MMTRSKSSLSLGRAIIYAAVVMTMAAACEGCKGRRASDELVPNGETIEVEVSLPVDTLQTITQENEI